MSRRYCTCRVKRPEGYDRLRHIADVIGDIEVLERSARRSGDALLVGARFRDEALRRAGIYRAWRLRLVKFCVRFARALAENEGLRVEAVRVSEPFDLSTDNFPEVRDV